MNRCNIIILGLTSLTMLLSVDVFIHLNSGEREARRGLHVACIAWKAGTWGEAGLALATWRNTFVGTEKDVGVHRARNPEF